MHLPRDVFHRQTVEEQLQDLEARYSLADATYEVREGRQSVITRTGFVAAKRILTIRMVGREPYGWKVGIRTSPQWGVLPYGGLYGRNWLWDGDRFHGELGVSAPYRQFLFEEEPQWRWLHGHLELDYRFPPFVEVFAPDVRARFDSSLYRREDLGLRSYHGLETQATAGMAFLVVPELTLSLGVGVNWIWAGGIEPVPDEPQLAQASERIRTVVTIGADTDLGDDALRMDLRDRLRLNVRVAMSNRNEVLVESQLTYRWSETFGAHDLIVSGRGLWMGGDVQFWDEVGLAGDYSRIFFAGRYWVREALQAQVAFRFSLSGEDVKLGIFNDLSFFGDRTTGEVRFAFGDGAGPSLHFLVFDLIGIDLYYAFGVDRHGFDHNFAFTVGSVF